MRIHKKSILAAGLAFSLFLYSGCALFLIGAGVAGGIAISEDEIEGAVEKPFDRAYQASREVFVKEGFIKQEDRPHGTMEGEVGKSDVKITVSQATEKSVKIRVKARKDYKVVPDLNLANELYNQINQKLK